MKIRRRMVALWTMAALLLAAFPTYAFDPCDAAQRASYRPIVERYVSGLLFRIETCGAAPSYLFGTVHSDDPILLETAVEALHAIARSDAAGFEYIEPQDAEQAARRWLFLGPEVPGGLPGLIGTELYSKLTIAMQEFAGVPEEALRRFKPWAAAVMLQYPPAVDDGTILDDRLQQAAEQRDLPLFGLETMEEQFRLFDGMTLETQISMLEDTLADLGRIERMNAEMIAGYRAKDLRALEQQAEEEVARLTDPALKRFLQEDLVNNRNRIMTERLWPRLRQGRQFTGVGALHLPGPEGMLSLLEQRGAMIEVVDPAPVP